MRTKDGLYSDGQLRFSTIWRRDARIIIIIIIIGVGLTSPGTAATSGLLYSPR
jgi:hypothetical protein